MLLSLLVFIAERAGWTAVASWLKAKQSKASDPTPIAEAHDLGVAQEKVQVEDTNIAQSQTAIDAGTKADVDLQRKPSSSVMQDDPFNLDTKG